MQQKYQCPRCGAVVGFGTRFCSNCGTALSWSDTQQSQTDLSNQGDNISSEHRQTSKTWKVLGAAILGLLIVISLFVFGPATAIKVKLLNPDFIVSEVNQLELASVSNEIFTQQSSEGLPVEIVNAISSTIDKLEPKLKEGISTSIYQIYDFLLGRRDSPELGNVLRNTFLSANFINSLVEETDVLILIKPIVYQQVDNWIPQELNINNDYIHSVIDDVLQKKESWIKEQIKTAASLLVDYLLGDQDKFYFAIPTGPFMEETKAILLEDIQELFPEMAGLPSALIQPAFDQFFDQFTQQIPESFEIDESMIGPDVPADIKASLTEAENSLRQMQQYIGNFQAIYIFLIVFILLLIAGICLIFREIKGTTLTLSIIFIICGAAELICFLISRSYLSEQLGQLSDDVPLQLQFWLQQFVNHTLAPLQILSIGLIIAGFVLLLVSLLYKPKYAGMGLK